MLRDRQRFLAFIAFEHCVALDAGEVLEILYFIGVAHGQSAQYLLHLS